jgi:hypothetical protein
MPIHGRYAKRGRLVRVIEIGSPNGADESVAVEAVLARANLVSEQCEVHLHAGLLGSSDEGFRGRREVVEFHGPRSGRGALS